MSTMPALGDRSSPLCTRQVSDTDCRTSLVQGLDVKVWRKYEDFVEELSERFPHERDGIRKFYGECWAVFNALNSLELKSLEEPRYLLGGRHPFRAPPGLCLCRDMQTAMQQSYICSISSNTVLGR